MNRPDLKLCYGLPDKFLPLQIACPIYLTYRFARFSIFDFRFTSLNSPYITQTPIKLSK